MEKPSIFEEKGKSLGGREQDSLRGGGGRGEQEMVAPLGEAQFDLDEGNLQLQLRVEKSLRLGSILYEKTPISIGGSARRPKRESPKLLKGSVSI